ncbi:hypothetical protein [Marinobacterium marinum]|uniref:Type II secretion system protein GspC N-terminal domain-containing protein n=1 Tax=Marinobacterium marinum TaxID=2756129 RepID=A0A7W1WWJ9_9GAMM|nr:hypothetical protein [Marinobacterium marinum]MBA4501550.1 hypothetical protein [Marinobacterium marinum]
MNAIRMRYRLVCLLLLMMLPGLTRSDTQAAPGVPDLQLPPAPSLGQFDEILERPLFSPSRSPDVDTGPAPDQATAEELKAQWQLTGILLVGSEFRALLQQRNGGLQRVLGTGMPLDDSWVLIAIEQNAVRLQAGDVEVQLVLREPRDTGPVQRRSDRIKNGSGSRASGMAPDQPPPKEVSNE